MMHLGVSLSPFGHHPAAWREKGATPRALEVGNFAAQAQKAQDGALDFVLFPDAQAHRPRTGLTPQTVPFDPTILVAALATRIKRIGFVATAASGQHELYNLARRFASLDLISRGPGRLESHRLGAHAGLECGVCRQSSARYGKAGMRTLSSTTRRRVASSCRKRCTFSIIEASISPSGDR